MWLNILNILLLSDLSAPSKSKKSNQLQLNASNSFQNCPFLESIPLRQLHVSLAHPSFFCMSTQLFPWRKKADTTLVCGDCSHSASVAWVHGRPCYVPNMRVVPQGHSSRLTGPFWNPLALQLFISLRWHLLWSFFYFSLRSASQQAASNCYIFSWQEETAHITSRDVA